MEEGEEGRGLKGLRHEDFTTLGFFFAKIITKRLYSDTKYSCKTMRKNIK